MAPANPFGRILGVFRHPWALLLFGLAILEGAVLFGFATYLAPALEAHGENAAVAGLVVGAYGVAVLIGTRSFRVVARHAGPPLILAAGAAMILAGFLVAARVQDVPSILTASLLAGGAYAFMHSTFQTWATDMVPEARGTAVALFVMFIFTGASIATGAMAGLAGAHRFDTIFRYGAAAVVPVLVLGTIARWRYPGSEPETAAVPP